MSAVDCGGKAGMRFRLHQPALFEKMTIEEYRKYGRVVARQQYKSLEKQNEFMQGWYGSNRQFFCFMADGPRRRIISLTIRCDLCGAEETLEVDTNTTGAYAHEHRPCPVCQADWAG